ncbi:MAG: ABC-F family ATP-binding cassette domain-containing protein [Blastochloris sp.]|nr:ABC-F family ATP-binding cassette domain-containing protein [Blastochloris sp.]
MDEPTNNLDIPSAEVLEHALDEFAGTVIVVSHDRYFLDRVVDRIFEIRDGELHVYEGGYSFTRSNALGAISDYPDNNHKGAKTQRREGVKMMYI